MGETSSRLASGADVSGGRRKYQRKRVPDSSAYHVGILVALPPVMLERITAYQIKHSDASERRVIARQEAIRTLVAAAIEGARKGRKILAAPDTPRRTPRIELRLLRADHDWIDQRAEEDSSVRKAQLIRDLLWTSLSRQR